jgi:hypothetical protein
VHGLSLERVVCHCPTAHMSQLAAADGAAAAAAALTMRDKLSSPGELRQIGAVSLWIDPRDWHGMVVRLAFGRGRVCNPAFQTEIRVRGAVTVALFYITLAPRRCDVVTHTGTDARRSAAVRTHTRTQRTQRRHTHTARCQLIYYPHTQALADRFSSCERMLQTWKVRASKRV